MDPFYGWSGGHGWVWMLAMAFLVLCATLMPGRLANGRSHVHRAIEKLHRRYATGEISAEQYREMKRSANETLDRGYATGEIPADEYQAMKRTLNG
jgi:uncharacterized membrane protein